MFFYYLCIYTVVEKSFFYYPCTYIAYKKLNICNLCIYTAYKILFLSKLLLKEAVSELEKNSSPFVKEMVDFIKTSKRGIARPGN